MRVPPTLTVALSLWLSLACCSSPHGQVCSIGSQCPLNSYCLVNQCVAPDTMAQNLSVVVTPSDPALAPQQFLPDQYQTVNGFSTIILTAPQVFSGHVALPANCGDAGYPVHFEFEGPSLIPGVPNDFQFDTDESGDLSAVLPVGSYSESVFTSVACAAPVYVNDVVISSSRPPGQLEFYAPIVEQGPISPSDGGEDAGAVSASLDISGEVDVPEPDGGLPIGAAVRILALTNDDAGVPTSVRLSGDQPLQLVDGVLRFGSTFVPGGPAVLPVLPFGQTPTGVPGIGQKTNVLCGIVPGRTPSPVCDYFVLEIGPSSVKQYLTTIDYNTFPAGEPEFDDAGENPLVILHTIPPLPLNPALTFDLPITAVSNADPIPSAAVTIASVDGGIANCPPDAGFTCHLTATGMTDPANGTFTFPVVPGRYALTLDPPAPLGSSVTVVDVLADAGELSVVSGPGTLVGGHIDLPAVPAVEVKGTVREPGPEPTVDGPLLPSGEVEFLSDLTPVALAPLSGGSFNLLVAPGTYALLIEPDSSTRFPVQYVTITVDENLPRQSYTLAKPALLNGIVEVENDAGLPVPVQAYLEFYSVTSDSDGGVAYPVANAVTDSEGRWSAAGPPPGPPPGQ